MTFIDRHNYLAAIKSPRKFRLSPAKSPGEISGFQSKISFRSRIPYSDGLSLLLPVSKLIEEELEELVVPKCTVIFQLAAPVRNQPIGGKNLVTGTSST